MLGGPMIAPPFPVPTKFLHALFALAIVAGPASAADPDKNGWRQLFNGKDLSGWDTYLSIPQKAWDVPDVPRDETGAYTQPIGMNRDPLKVFTVVQEDGQPAIRISGQGFGVMTTKEPFANYHMRLQFKWGEKKWAPRLQAVRDSGLLYHCHGEQGAVGKHWIKSIEFQIQENDCGDLFAIGTQITVPVRQETGANGKTLNIYDPKGTPVDFVQKPPLVNRAVRMENHEKSHGEWNTLDLICLGDDSIHIVNGVVVMRLRDGKRLDGAEPAALAEGTISIQTEGAEVFYRDIEIKPITEIPTEFAEKPSA
jgi:hypothetical protein